jgi:hypothetical protein
MVFFQQRCSHFNMEVALPYEKTVECNLDLFFKQGNVFVRERPVRLLGGPNDVPLGAFHDSNDFTLLL